MTERMTEERFRELQELNAELDNGVYESQEALTSCMLRHCNALPECLDDAGLIQLHRWLKR
jgi:hypothetical protein